MPRNKWKWKHDNPKPMGFSKAVLRGRFIALQAYLKKQEKNQINTLTLLEKEEMKNPRVSRRKEILKIRAEINEKETETIAKINKTKSWFFEKINKRQTISQTHKKIKKGRIKSIKLEMKMERSQQATQKYKGSAIICQ